MGKERRTKTFEKEKEAKVVPILLCNRLCRSLFV